MHTETTQSDEMFVSVLLRDHVSIKCPVATHTHTRLARWVSGATLIRSEGLV